MQVVRIGLDLAKYVFEVHGVDAHGKTIVRKTLRRAAVSVFFAYPRDWKAITVEQFTQEIEAYIRWYNEKRIKKSLGSLSAIEYRESLGLTGVA